MNDVLAYALMLAHGDPEATAGLRAMLDDPDALNAALRDATAVKEDRGGLVLDQSKHRWVNPNKDQPGAAPAAPAGDADATAKIAAMPGLTPEDRTGLLGAVKSIYGAGKKAIRVAKAVTLALHDEAKLWGTRLALAGVTYEEALPDAKELSNPLTGSTSATGGVDVMGKATGVPAASFLATKIAPQLATFAVLKVKSLLAGLRAEGIVMESDDERAALIAEFRAAMVAAFAKATAAAADQGEETVRESGPGGAGPSARAGVEGQHQPLGEPGHRRGAPARGKSGCTGYRDS